jgi:gas vesicle protein
MEKDKKPSSSNNMLGVLAGILIGGLVGALTMLLMAPQSGKDTRKQIKQKGIELRDGTTEMVEEAIAQVQTSASKIVADGREKIKELTDHGKGLAAEQLDRVADAAQSGKKAIQNSK